MNIEWVYALIGGALIGLAASLMLLSSGRVAGISSILYGLLNPEKGEVAWRLYFVVGLLFGGLVLRLMYPGAWQGALTTPDWTVGVAGLLVGFGTVLGSGCTSGHGVCGISRLSLRSLVATLFFIAAGILAVVIFRSVGVLP